MHLTLIISLCVFHVKFIQVSSLILSPKQQCILNDVSWKVKVKILNSLAVYKNRRRGVSIQSLILPNKSPNSITHDDFNNRNSLTHSDFNGRSSLTYNDFSKRNVDLEALMWRRKNVHTARELKRNVAIDFLIQRDTSPVNIENINTNDESALSFEEKSDSNNNDLDLDAIGVHDGLQTDHKDTRRQFVNRRQAAEPKATDHQANEAETERDMKLKLFRLMYDTVKDNDELVKKADEIKKDYDNSIHFEIGFVMGAITDKVNTMSDVALTVERLYDEWKPIEHVNAYEQIANQAIEINHLVDILQSAYKKTKKDKAKTF